MINLVRRIKRKYRRNGVFVRVELLVDLELDPHPPELYDRASSLLLPPLPFFPAPDDGESAQGPLRGEGHGGRGQQGRGQEERPRQV